MGELHDWLTRQHPGLRTYKVFQQKALQLASAEPEHRACYRMLAALADGYIDSFDEEPLPVEVAQQAFERLLGVVSDAEQSIQAPPADQLATLNKIAAATLL
ncbi:MAG: hypothetical protein AB1586_04485 [Pseudomonadota bacterium]